MTYIARKRNNYFKSNTEACSRKKTTRGQIKTHTHKKVDGCVFNQAPSQELSTMAENFILIITE